MQGVSAGCVPGHIRVGLDGTGLHVGDELLRNLSKHIFGQTSHAKHMVPSPVHVVPKWHKLQESDIGCQSNC